MSGSKSLSNPPLRRTWNANSRRFLGALNDAVVVVDLWGRVGLANAALERVAGWPEHKVLGRRAWSFVHPSDRSQVQRSVLAWTEDGVSNQAAARVARPGGAWTELTLLPHGVDAGDGNVALGFILRDPHASPTEQPDPARGNAPTSVPS